MSWKAPYRPKGEITQNYNDGLVTIYAVTDSAQPGRLPMEKLECKAVLRYEERRLGIQRYYAGKQVQVEVERVVRTPRLRRVSSQDVAVTEDGAKYRIDLVQPVTDVHPPSMDLTLTRIFQSDTDTEEDTYGLV